MSRRKTPDTDAPHTPAARCSVESSSWIAPASARMPRPSSATMKNTTDEWPRLNQKPTLSGRLSPVISDRVVLSMTAMWSASKACRIPSVYAVTPSPTPKIWPATRYFCGAMTQMSSPHPMMCSSNTNPAMPSRLCLSALESWLVKRLATSVPAGAGRARTVTCSDWMRPCRICNDPRHLRLRAVVRRLAPRCSARPVPGR